MYEDSGTHVLLGRRLVVSRKPLGRLGAAAGAAAATSLRSHFDINETLVLSAALSVEAALFGHTVDRVGDIEYSDSREGCGAAPDRGLRLLQLDSSSPPPPPPPSPPPPPLLGLGLSSRGGWWVRCTGKGGAQTLFLKPMPQPISGSRYGKLLIIMKKVTQGW